MYSIKEVLDELEPAEQRTCPNKTTRLAHKRLPPA
jgi:hypothetical protein